MHTLLGDRPDPGSIPLGPSIRQQAEDAEREEAAKSKPADGAWTGVASKGFKVVNGRIETDFTPPVGKPPESDAPKVAKASPGQLQEAVSAAYEKARRRGATSTACLSVCYAHGWKLGTCCPPERCTDCIAALDALGA